MTEARADLLLELADGDALLAAWARHQTEGAIPVPAPAKGLPNEANVCILVGNEPFPGQRARVVDRPSSDARTIWLELTPTADLVKAIEGFAKPRRRAFLAAPTVGAPRAALEMVLDVHFGTMEQLRARYASDMRRGGLFVTCSPPPDLRTWLTLLLTLPNGEHLRLKGEVVHRTETGVGVQLFDPGELEPIATLLRESPPPRRRVLVIDDEAIWRSTLVRALTQRGVEVRVASDGRDGLAKLIDGFFELDLVVVDLHMPHIDGRGLIERVRHSGGEYGLKIVLFSAAGPDELAALAEPGLATAVFSKLAPLDELMAALERELDLPPTLQRATPGAAASAPPGRATTA